MARTRTIADDEILAAARKLFRTKGHDVTTRQVAEAAGISEGVLYQRFGNKDRLFFAAMAPAGPDLVGVLGGEPPSEGPREYLRNVVPRMVDYFGEVLPLALRLITHPSFDRSHLNHGQAAIETLERALLERLMPFEKGKRMRKGTASPAAQLLVRLAHDLALARVMSGKHGPRRPGDIDAIVELLWQGASPRR
jgi:AcrR family transcriptional regulator